MNLGSSGGCGHTLIVESGGLVNIVGGTPDRLNICRNEIARGGGAGCNPYPAGPLPYCEPSGGFTGPTGFDENGYNSTLPVTVSYFVAKQQETAIVLDWATEKEERFDRFVVQRSVGHFEFQDLGVLKGVGYNTNSLQQYSFSDTHPVVGTNYYRLKAVDIDDSFEYFGPISADFTHDRQVWVTPNPASADKIGLTMNFVPSDDDRIQIINSQGIVLRNVSTNGNTVSNAFYDLKPGSYVLKYSASNFTSTVRFVIID